VRLQARVGVATGHVVVGDQISEGISDKDAVSGDTLNLADRDDRDENRMDFLAGNVRRQGGRLGAS
jgi:hypothetical protein